MEAMIKEFENTIFIKEMEDCECCRGFVEECKGQTCKILGQCFCFTKHCVDDIPSELDGLIIMQEM